MAQSVVLVHARDAHALARKTTERLKRLGVGVERRLIDQIDAAPSEQRFILLWSRGVARAGAVRQRLLSLDNLSILRAASAPMPPSLRKRVYQLPRRRGVFIGTRDVSPVANVQSAQRRITPMTTRTETRRWEAVIPSLAMALVVAWASYVVSPAFAERVDLTVASIDTTLTDLVE